MVRCRPHYWLAVAECPRQQIETMLDRIRSGFSEADRNLPGQELPQLSLRVKGVWPIETQSEQLVEQFRAELPPSTDRSRVPRVLVVDDDREMLRGLEIRLRASGFEVLTADNGRSGLEAAVRHRPDAILVDDCAGLDDGSHALDLLTDSAGTMNIPLVMLSGDARGRKHERGPGGPLLLSKPCDAGAVTAALHKVIANSDPRRR